MVLGSTKFIFVTIWLRFFTVILVSTWSDSKKLCHQLAIVFGRIFLFLDWNITSVSSGGVRFVCIVVKRIQNKFLLSLFKTQQRQKG